MSSGPEDARKSDKKVMPMHTNRSGTVEEGFLFVCFIFERGEAGQRSLSVKCTV